MITDCWDVNVYFSGGFKDSCAFFNFNLGVVDEEFNRFRNRLSLPRVGYCFWLAC